MVSITFSSKMARLLIHPREERRDYLQKETLGYLEDKIAKGKWGDVDSIWITPNLILNSLLVSLDNLNLPTIKPFILYNGHNRREMAIKYNLPLKAYVRYTPGNPKMPEEEKLIFDLP